MPMAPSQPLCLSSMVRVSDSEMSGHSKFYLRGFHDYSSYLCHSCNLYYPLHQRWMPLTAVEEYIWIWKKVDESMGKFNLLVLPIPSKAFWKTRLWFPEHRAWLGKFNLLISNIPIKPSVIQETVWVHWAWLAFQPFCLSRIRIQRQTRGVETVTSRKHALVPFTPDLDGNGHLSFWKPRQMQLQKCHQVTLIH